MTKEGLEKIIKKLQKRSLKYESVDTDKSVFYDRCAYFVEHNMSEFEDGLEDEEEDFKEVVKRYKEIEDEMENPDFMYPDGDDDE
jgi:chaperonin cofactor prefoldin